MHDTCMFPLRGIDLFKVSTHCTCPSTMHMSLHTLHMSLHTTHVPPHYTCLSTHYTCPSTHYTCPSTHYTCPSVTFLTPNIPRNLHPFVPSSQQTAEDQSECLACSMALLQVSWDHVGGLGGERDVEEIPKGREVGLPLCMRYLIPFFLLRITGA